MAAFAMCRACRSEYENSSDHRYHAQPIACPSCGPRLQALDGHGQAVETAQPLDDAVAAMRRGKIVALKSLGGYHLACIAEDDRAVAELRRRKHRDEKPLAVMVRSIREAVDLGEDLRLVLFSVTEGEDKPLKYPTIFHTADVAIITKTDLAKAVDFDADAAHRSIQSVRPGMEIHEVSSKSGAGMDLWMNSLHTHRSEVLSDRRATSAFPRSG